MPEFVAATPAFAVQDIDRAIAFYRDNLDFTPDAQGPGFAVLQRNRVFLHLWLSDDTSWKKRTGQNPIISGAESFLAGTVSCRIEVSDIDDLFASCTSKGIVHPNGPLKHAVHGAMEFAILDHDGNLITFFEMD
ncbi:MAG: VOC family protein [Minwuia sp.]|nr:VOC family protein [Minwuia sp.]